MSDWLNRLRSLHTKTRSSAREHVREALLEGAARAHVRETNDMHGRRGKQTGGTKNDGGTRSRGTDSRDGETSRGF